MVITSNGVATVTLPGLMVIRNWKQVACVSHFNTKVALMTKLRSRYETLYYVILWQKSGPVNKWGYDLYLKTPVCLILELSTSTWTKIAWIVAILSANWHANSDRCMQITAIFAKKSPHWNSFQMQITWQMAFQLLFGKLQAVRPNVDCLH